MASEDLFLFVLTQLGGTHLAVDASRMLAIEGAHDAQGALDVATLLGLAPADLDSQRVLRLQHERGPVALLVGAVHLREVALTSLFSPPTLLAPLMERASILGLLALADGEWAFVLDVEALACR